jgi:hypothetical protein
MRFYWVYNDPPLFTEILLPVYWGCPMWAIHWERSSFDHYTVYLDII